MPTLVDLIGGGAKGRTNSRQTSFFLNVGAIGAQFEAVAARVYKSVRDKGLGQDIPTDWFLQDTRD
jgi:alanine dehydrogenase